MKKKKGAPVVLIAILVIFVGVVAVMNANPASEEDPNLAARRANAEAQTASKRETPTKERMAMLVDSGTDQPTSEGGPSQTQGLSPVPVILLPENRMPAPVPDDNNITSQWYTEKSRLKNK